MAVWDVSCSDETLTVSDLSISHRQRCLGGRSFMQPYSQLLPEEEGGGGLLFKWNTPGSTSTHFVSLFNCYILIHRPPYCWNSSIGEMQNSLSLDPGLEPLTSGLHWPLTVFCFYLNFPPVHLSHSSQGNVCNI